MSEAVPEFDLYGTLGVPVSATTEMIEMAFRTAAKMDHPDAAADAPGSTARMQRLNVARSWLADPTRRAIYDHVRGVDGPRWSVDLPTIDPTGAWPTQRPESTVASEARATWTIVALSALAVNVLTILAGIGSNLMTVALFALSLVIVLYAGVLVVLGWIGPIHRP